MIRLLYTLFYLSLCTLWGCTQPTVNNPMDNHTKHIITVVSSLPTPTPSTTAMFHIVDENGTYQTADGATKQGVVIQIYSTESDDIPKHRVGEGSEFELVGYRYRVHKIIRSEDYTKSRDKVELEVLGQVEGYQEEE